MSDIRTKVKFGLDESRMLVLGAQVLLGFQFRAVLEPGFDRLPPAAQYVKLGALGLMLVVIALLLSPPPWHQIVELGEDTSRMHRFVTRVMDVTLLPFAVALGADCYVAARTHWSTAAAAGAAIGAATLALVCWYGVPLAARARHRTRATKETRMAQTSLSEKIDHVLTEARVVLPGVQALLGFQFAALLTDSFDRIPESSKLVHVGSLALIAFATVLLMTPAAWHRIVERGEETDRFHRVASRFVLAAMAPLAFGISAELFVVVRKVTASTTVSIAAAAVSLALFYGLWFGLTIWQASRG